MCVCPYVCVCCQSSEHSGSAGSSVDSQKSPAMPSVGRPMVLSWEVIQTQMMVGTSLLFPERCSVLICPHDPLFSLINNEIFRKTLGSSRSPGSLITRIFPFVFSLQRDPILNKKKALHIYNFCTNYIHAIFFSYR